MNINKILSILSPIQVSDILTENGVEKKGTVLNIENVGKQVYEYDVYNILTGEMVNKRVKFSINDNFSISIKYIK